ncbi:lytic transglycosylase domain-containing protein [Streptomyces sp. NBC_01456]|uniref:aggregation-promoting factor C-terminal-like domain-containing protein n=1 Tax=Streptomyces sp. NBC_01456 TaxID=2975868 RepID=UPI002E366E3D|nr:transglycosylase SLT domain-containing protein [Streptomyces sp. NBC_01456]
MSRPKLPAVSWRTCRVFSVAVLSALLLTAYLVQPADAKPEDPRPQPVLTPSMTNLDVALRIGNFQALGALQHQADAQAAAHRKAQAEAAAQRKTEARAAAKRKAAAEAAAQRKAQARAAAQRAEQRSSRAASRKALTQAPTVAGAKALARARLSSTQYACLDSVIRRESGWNHRATNPSSGAYGLMQALPGSKMSSAGADWRTNPRTQLKWGLSYIESRYGTPCGAWNFWQKNGWY